MKNKQLLLMTIISLTLTGCATTQHQEASIQNEAKKEAILNDSEQTEAMLLEVLNKDGSVNTSEKNEISLIIKKSYQEYKDVEVNINQQKTLLIKEFISSKKDHAKADLIKKQIKKSYAIKTNIMMKCFDDISKIVKKHPASSEAFFNKAASFWPMRDKAP